ncbi:hypothetical protein Tco_0858392 [Tanacetum coccineum]|uniref:Uncharacterized protein n=1 Tax=Tanacetum coccineum TaxID=301880 RepID=A0ABQ5B935_9ASTR
MILILKSSHHGPSDAKHNPSQLPRLLSKEVMAISIISVSSDSSEDSVGTPAERVILFGTIPTTIPDTTPINDITDIDTPDTPPSPAHGTPFTEITSFTQRSPVIPRHRVMILAPGQPIPHGRPYRYHSNGPMIQLEILLQIQSSKAINTHLDATSISSSRNSLSDHSSPDLPTTSAGPSHKRRRSPMTFVPTLAPVFRALSPDRTDLIPSPKRIRSPESATDLEGCSEDSFEPYVPREVRLGVDIMRMKSLLSVTVARDDVETSARDPIVVSDDEDTPPVVPEVIPEPAQEGAAGSTYETLGDLVQRFHDHTEAIPVHRIQVIEGVQREQGRRIVGVESAVTALTERIAELERDNSRLRGTASVESQRVDRLQRGMSRMQRELRQIRRLRFYDRVRVGRLEACARKHMGYRP